MEARISQSGNEALGCDGHAGPAQALDHKALNWRRAHLDRVDECGHAWPTNLDFELCGEASQYSGR